MMISLRTVLFLACLVFITAIPCFSSHTDITPQQAKDLIDSTDTLIIIDVREPSEYCGAGGHIPGALNYPWFSGVLEDRYEELINDEILVVCQSGGRSNQAANFLDSKGYTLVYDMQGGMNTWQWETVPCGVSEDKYSGGKGTEEDPYQITTAEDLIALGETPEDYDKHFILTADIDLDPNLPDGKVFDKAIIGWDASFEGIFDGMDHIVQNLDMNAPTGDYVGLFGRVGSGGKIQNLGTTDVKIAGVQYVGGFVGGNFGVLSDCWSTGTVTGTGTCIGGLVGMNSYGIVTRSYSAANVSGRAEGGIPIYVGGLVGYNNRGAVSDCYVTGSVSEIDEELYSATAAGGLIGFDEDGTVTSCYSAGHVDGPGLYVGGLLGSISGGSIVTTSFWDIESSGQTTSAGGVGKTTAEMMDPNTFISAGWDFVSETVNGPNDIWWILEGKDYPRLWWQLPADDFEDGQAEPLWIVYAMEPELAWLEETNGRLEVNTTGSMENVDAIYVSDGWKLNTNEPFAICVDFYFGKVGVGDGRVNIGVVPNIDPSAMQWAEFEVGTFDDKPFYLYEVRDKNWVGEEVDDRSSDDGTLYVSYDPDKDELYFGKTGYGKDKAMWTVTRLIHGRWQSDSVYVILSGGSEGMILTGEDAWLDNFTVDDGSILQ